MLKLEYILKPYKIIISFLIFLLAAFPLHAEEFNGEVHLKVRGLKNGPLIHSENSTYYYLTKNQFKQPLIAAFHDIPEDEPVFPAEVIFQADSNGSYVDGYAYPEEMLDQFQSSILPNMLQYSPHTQRIRIFHYNSRVLLANGLEMKRKWDEIEQPVAIVDFHKYRNQWNFRYIKKNDFKIYKGERFSVKDTLEIRSLYTRDIASSLEEIGIVKAASNVQNSFALKEAARKVKASRKEGIVYKSKHFWNSFYTFEVMEKVFKGDLDGLNKTANFKVYFNSFIEGYYNTCGALLPGDSVNRRQVIERITSEDGVEQYRDTTSDITIRVDPRFSQPYDAYRNTYVRATKNIGMQKHLQMKSAIQAELKKYPLAKRSFADVSKKAAIGIMDDLPIIQLDKFFSKVPCHSATMFQMKENLLRAANSQSSLQESGIKIPNSRQESISPEKYVAEKTIYDACKDRRVGDSDVERYCRCFNRYASMVMTEAELKYYTDSFQLYYDEVANSQMNTPNTDFSRLYTPRSKCMR